MTENVWMALIAMIGTSVASIIATVGGIALIYAKARQAEVLAEKNNEDLKELHITVDGRMAELIRVSEAKARAEGLLQGGSDSQALLLEEIRKSSLDIKHEAKAVLDKANADAEAILALARTAAEEVASKARHTARNLLNEASLRQQADHGAGITGEIVARIIPIEDAPAEPGVATVAKHPPPAS